MGSEQALQCAVVAALAADAGFAALVAPGAVYDRLIDRAAFPYVVLGTMTTLDWSTATEAGTEHVFVLEAWSDEAGKRQVQEIAGAVRAVLHDRPLALAAGRLVNLRLERAQTERLARTGSTARRCASAPSSRRRRPKPSSTPDHRMTRRRIRPFTPRGAVRLRK